MVSSSLSAEVGYIGSSMIYGMELTNHGQGEKLGAIDGILENGDMKIEALVGRSLDHITVTEGEVQIKGLMIHYWRH